MPLECYFTAIRAFIAVTSLKFACVDLVRHPEEHGGVDDVNVVKPDRKASLEHETDQGVEIFGKIATITILAILTFS